MLETSLISTRLPATWRSRAKVVLGFMLLVWVATCELAALTTSHGILSVPPISGPQVSTTFWANGSHVIADQTNTSVGECLPNPHRVDPIFGTTGPEYSHYCNVNGTVKYFPLQRCALPPPQPFWMIGIGTATKSLGMALVFWTNMKKPYSNFDKCKDLALTIFTIANVAIASIFITRKAWELSEHLDTLWAQHECWGATLVTAPWAANFYLYVGKSEATRLFTRQRDGHQTRKSTFYTKLKLYYAVVFVLLFALVFLEGCFLVTHVTVGMLVFFPVTLLIIMFVHCGYQMIEAIMEYAFGQEVADDANSHGISWIPAAIGFDVGLQWVSYATLDFYHGVGLKESAWLASTERQHTFYFENMLDMLREKTWLSQLMNQWLP